MPPTAQVAPILGSATAAISKAVTKVLRPALAASNPAISAMLVTMAAVPPKAIRVGLIILRRFS
jgi:hypothetical protein